MRALLINNDTQLAADRIIEHAKNNVLSMDDMLDIKNKKAIPPGLREGFTLLIPMGYRVVYSHENQEGIGKIIKRMSVSVDADHKLPSVASVEQIMKLFRFNHDIASGELPLLQMENVDETTRAIQVGEEVE